MNVYLPEGNRLSADELSLNNFNPYEIYESGRIISSLCVMCDREHNLAVNIAGKSVMIPRDEGAIGIAEGLTRDIALISRVNKTICFKIIEVDNENGGFKISRKAAQKECYENYISKLKPGDIIPARITRLERFGAFADAGCGISALIPIDMISVSRISHSADRFFCGQNIFAVVKSVLPSDLFPLGKITLSHKELLGTWEENADLFEVGETVTGIVRSVEDYGIFVELTPNLAGLADVPEFGGNIYVNQPVSVYIKAVNSLKMKIKLVIVDAFNPGLIASPEPKNSEENQIIPYKYTQTYGNISSWLYSPHNCEKVIFSSFSEHC